MRPGAEVEPARYPLKVLVVEDSPDDALLTIDALGVDRYEPFWKRVETASEMKQALVETKWELIIADHRLPRFSALEAFEIYRQFELDIPFIIVSGVIGEEVAVAAMRAGVHDYLSKGNLARLAPAVYRELGEAESRRERKRAEAALHSAYTELAAIQASAPMLMLLIDSELRVERANDFAVRFTGRSVEEMTGLLPGSSMGCLNSLANPKGCGHGPACSACMLRRTVLDTVRTGTPHDSVEAWLPIWAAGEKQERCLLLSTAPMQNGTARKALVCAQDITGLKQAELELVRQSTTLRRQAQMINLSADAIIMTSPDRIISGWNAGAEEMYGWKEAEVVGKSTWTLLGVSLVRAREVDEILQQQGRWEGELVHTRRNGQSFIVESRKVLVRNELGAPAGILSINRDITERKQAELRVQDLNCDLDRQLAELQKASAEKDVLLREVQHRVKNNLQVISSMLSLEARRLGKGAALNILQNNRDRIRSMALIHEKFCYSKDVARIDFGEYVRSLAGYFMSSYSLDESAIELSTDVNLELEMDDAIPCGLILQELLSNSMKYAFRDGSGKISIGSQRADGELRLRYHDSGPGLPTGVDIQHPVSLGLQLVNDLVSQLQGRLEYRNSAGATFEVCFKSAPERMNDDD